ncbi:hypothetical protein DL93DRAFT_2168540 [Clavulina sp. PMI_390]|nr:hypothetical protein DL93DRAFT_2168540 [Clavulina sp. PMI_390]
MTLEYESQFFDFDSISSSSPRTPPDHDILGITSTIMYQDPLNYGQSPPPFADGKQHQQQQQPMYPQSTSPQPDFFTAQSASPPSFPGTPDYNATSFAALTAGSPHWSASSPGSTSVTDGQANPADLQNWTS